MKTIIKSDIVSAFEVAYTTCKVKVGNADIKLMNQRELVDFAVSWISAKISCK